MRNIFVVLLFVGISGQSQSLRDINSRYLYNPVEPVSLTIKVVHGAGGWQGLYEIYLRDSTFKAEALRVQWELRETILDKAGTIIHIDSTLSHSNGVINGSIGIVPTEGTKLLVGKVMNTRLKRAWMFYKSFSTRTPLNGYLKSYNNIILSPFIKRGTTVTIASDTLYKIVSFYNDNFPVATPPFSEAAGAVSKGIQVDSAFVSQTGQPFTLNDKGLYLMQNDTSDTKGFAFRVEDDYPKYAKVESLVGPLVYICTKSEFERLKASKGEKKSFDRIILNITGNSERARTFMRSYFRRVELANHYFTSYKEGWKTDRGMIYIVFGLPDEVFKLSDKEIWSYNNNSFKIEFEFTKSSTLFDPDNFVLIRQRRYQETWYQVIDLWRNARF